MKHEILTTIALCLVIGSAGTAQAFNFGDLWSGVKETIGIGNSNQPEPKPALQPAPTAPATVNHIGSDGRIDTSRLNQNTHQNNHQFEVQTPSTSQNMVVTDRAHLANKAGLLAKAALIGRDAECESFGGTWYWEADKVGCDGVDVSFGCDGYLVGKARGMCENEGAKFVCGTSGIYCAFI